MDTLHEMLGTQLLNGDFMQVNFGCHATSFVLDVAPDHKESSYSIQKK